MLQGGEPITYEWFCNGARVRTATGRKPVLIVPAARPSDEGIYMCKVSNRDGEADSTEARLQVLVEEAPPPPPRPLAPAPPPLPEPEDE